MLDRLHVIEQCMQISFRSFTIGSGLPFEQPLQLNFEISVGCCINYMIYTKTKIQEMYCMRLDVSHYSLILLHRFTYNYINVFEEKRYFRRKFC